MFISYVNLKNNVLIKICTNPFNPLNLWPIYFQCNSKAKQVFSPFVMLNVAVV